MVSQVSSNIHHLDALAQNRTSEASSNSSNVEPRFASSPNINGMASCIQDVVDAMLLDAQAAPRAMITNHTQLLKVLKFCKDALPLEYQTSFSDPFIQYIQNLGSAQFQYIMQGTTPETKGLRGLIHDITDSIIQYYQEYQEEASDAFREVTSDLYTSFLTESKRRSGETGIHINPPEHGILPPMIKWGNPDGGPYTYTGPTTDYVKVGPALVNLPPANAEKGLMAWTTLGHETAGHDIIHADKGLEKELKKLVFQAVLNQSNSQGIAQYWANCVDEAASDVLGVLNLGPAAGIGLITYFRGSQKAHGNGDALRNNGPFSGPHPIDVLRGFIAAKTVELLDGFDPNLRTAWAGIIRRETQKDLQRRGGYVVINGYRIRADVMIDSAEKAAEVICKTKLKALEGHSLSEIISWSDDDERITNILRSVIQQNYVPLKIQEGQYAAHTISAATLEALSSGQNIQQIFDTMKGILSTMHSTNQTWINSSNFAPHFAYQIDADANSKQRVDLQKEFEKLQPV